MENQLFINNPNHEQDPNAFSTVNVITTEVINETQYKNLQERTAEAISMGGSISKPNYVKKNILLLTHLMTNDHLIYYRKIF